MVFQKISKVYPVSLQDFPVEQVNVNFVVVTYFIPSVVFCLNENLFKNT